MPRRYYSSTAARTTLSSGINSTATSITVASTSGFPGSYPYTLIIDQDQSTEEVVTVTAGSGTTLTVTRGVDGTTGVSHSSGATVNHGVSARDFDEPNSHVNDSTTDVHPQYVTKALVDVRGDLVAASGDNTPVRLAAGSNGQMLMADSGATAGLRYVDPPTNRSLIVNGAMQVAQRGTSVTGNTAGGYLTADRWNATISSLGTWTQTVETDAPTGSGLRKSLKMLCTTSKSSPAAANVAYMEQRIEGQDLQRIGKGTASAKQLSLSFWVKSNATGTYVVSLYDNDNARSVSASYSVSTSATWEQKTVTFPADTTGAFDNDNAGSLYLWFMLAAGSDYTSGTINTTWGSYTAANLAPGQTNLAAATNNYWQVTGVQLETGPVATPFEFEPYEATLRKCQRYYYRNTTGANGFADVTGFGAAASTTSAQVPVIHPVPMRVAPTAVEYSALKWRDAAANSVAISAASITSATPDVTIVAATSSSLTQHRPVTLCGDNSTTAYIALTAEL